MTIAVLFGIKHFYGLSTFHCISGPTSYGIPTFITDSLHSLHSIITWIMTIEKDLALSEIKLNLNNTPTEITIQTIERLAEDKSLWKQLVKDNIMMVNQCTCRDDELLFGKKGFLWLIDFYDISSPTFYDIPTFIPDLPFLLFDYHASLYITILYI